MESDYIVIEVDASEKGWGAILLSKPTEYSAKSTEKICRYASGKYKEKGNLASIDCEILGVINAINSFRLWLFKPFTVRTDCEAIVKFHKLLNEKKISNRRWLNFVDTITGNGYIVKFEHIKGKENTLADYLSREIHSHVPMS